MYLVISTAYFHQEWRIRTIPGAVDIARTTALCLMFQKHLPQELRTYIPATDLQDDSRVQTGQNRLGLTSTYDER